MKKQNNLQLTRTTHTSSVLMIWVTLMNVDFINCTTCVCSFMILTVFRAKKAIPEDTMSTHVPINVGRHKIKKLLKLFKL